MSGIPSYFGLHRAPDSDTQYLLFGPNFRASLTLKSSPQQFVSSLYSHNAKVARGGRKPSTSACHTECRSYGCSPSNVRCALDNLGRPLHLPSAALWTCGSAAMQNRILNTTCHHGFGLRLPMFGCKAGNNPPDEQGQRTR